MNIFDCSITGHYKRQKGLACEDAVYTRQYEDYSFMACADGHGDPKCRYARRGAELAVRIGARIVKEVRAASDDLTDFGRRLNNDREALFSRFVCAFVEAVLQDYAANHPEDTAFLAAYPELFAYAGEIYEVRDGLLPIKELRELAERRHRCEEAIYKITLLYGTTCNAAVVTPKFVFAFGIGDGDVIAVNGKRVEWLLPSSDQFSSTTHSLCGSFGSMMEHFHAVLVPICKGSRLSESRFMPEFVMIATDGLRNGFISDAIFAEKMLHIAEELKSGHGYLFVKNSEKWIEERATFGVTQDDISFCLCTGHPLKKPPVKKTGAKQKKNA